MSLNAAFNELVRPRLAKSPSFSVKTPHRFEVSDGNNEGFKSLTTLFEHLGKETQSDGMMVALHRDASMLETLFELGDRLNLSDFKTKIFKSARSSNSPIWFSPNDSETEHILSVPLILSRSVFSITLLFRDQNAAMRKRTLEDVSYHLPFVRAFLHLWLSYRRTQARILGLTAAINNSDVGMVLIGKSGKTLFISNAAEKMILANDGVRHNDGHLACKSLNETLRLQAAIEHVSNKSDPAQSDDFASSPVIAITRESKRPVMAAIVSHKCQHNDDEDTVAIVYLFDPESGLDNLLLPVCELYHLSPVETRLACLLANGSTLADAAEVMHVKEQTARSYLKQIFVKTDTNRQAELVWLLLKSSVRTGQHCQTGLV